VVLQGVTRRAENGIQQRYGYQRDQTEREVNAVICNSEIANRKSKI
jgi:uncharacterized protein YjbJ (UPF0337 family)